MKKIVFVSSLAALTVLLLQSLWINNVHKSYVNEKMIEFDKVAISSIGKELDIRSFGITSIKNKVENADSTEETRYVKQYTLNQTMLGNNDVGDNIYEIVQQLEQDALIEQHIYINMHVLDSVVNSELSKRNINDQYRIILFNKDTTSIGQAGSLPIGKVGNNSTRLYPIGTKEMQFIQIETEILLSDFMEKMLKILSVSAIMILIVILCVLYQMHIIKKQNELFKRREAGVNGTIHDLKSPLNSIITMLVWLRKKIQDNTVQNLIDNSLSQTKHLAEDIDSLLITARKDRQKLMLQKMEVDLYSLVSKARDGISVQYTHKLHTINTRFSSDDYIVYVDQMYLVNVLRNLMENALKYSDEGVIIDLFAKEEKKFTAISIADNGWGIEKKYQKKIFAQFYQIPCREGYVNKGYGIGLPFVKYVLANHGGYITVNSEPGKGSVFTIHIPIHKNNK